MARAILLVYSNCAVDKEQEFNLWYDTVHVPDMLAIDGFIAAQRFKLSGPGPQAINRAGEPTVAQYLVMYEMDIDDTRTVMKRVGEAMAYLRQRGRLFDGLQMVSSGTYVAIGDRQTSAAVSNAAGTT